MNYSAKPKSPMGKNADEIFYRALTSPIKATVVKKYVPKTSAKKKANTGRPKTAAKHRPKSPPQQITGPVYFRVPLIGAGAGAVSVSPIKKH